MSETKDDGGPAFPRPAVPFPEEQGGGSEPSERGMSLRDWFAGQALAASDWSNGGKIGVLTAACYELADAMLEARKR